MKTFFLTLFALLSSAMAFAPSPQVANVLKAGAAAFQVTALSAPAFAVDSIVESLPTQTLSLEVQFGAYLAVLLGTFLPCLFLINLYIQTESRAAGRAGGQDSK